MGLEIEEEATDELQDRKRRWRERWDGELRKKRKVEKEKGTEKKEK